MQNIKPLVKRTVKRSTGKQMSQASQTLGNLATGILMPKLANRFRVVFDFNGSPVDPNTILSLQTISIIAPPFAIANIATGNTSRCYDSIYPIEITFEEDLAGELMNVLFNVTQCSCNIIIELLDGNQNVTATSHFNDCRLSFLTRSSLNYATSAPINIHAVFSFGSSTYV